MKRIAMLLVTGVLSLAVYGSSGTDEAAKVVLDSATQVGRETLPPGVYVIRKEATTGGIPILSFRSKQKSFITTASDAGMDRLDWDLSGLVLAENAQGSRVERVVLAGRSYRFK